MLISLSDLITWRLTGGERARHLRTQPARGGRGYEEMMLTGHDVPSILKVSPTRYSGIKAKSGQIQDGFTADGQAPRPAPSWRENTREAP